LDINMKSTDNAQSTVDDAFAARSSTVHDAPPMTTYAVSREARTRRVPDFVDITDEIKDAVRASRVQRGRATVFAPGDVCSIIVNERESGLLEDLTKALARLTASDASESHPLVGSSSVVLPIDDGRLALGTWQSVLLVELTQARERSLDIEIVGER